MSSGNCLLLFGGSNHDVEMNDVFVMDLQNNRWEEVRCAGESPEGRFAHTSVVHNGKIYVYGGIVRSARELCGLFELSCESFDAKPSLTSLATRWLAQSLLHSGQSPLQGEDQGQLQHKLANSTAILPMAAQLPTRVVSELSAYCRRLQEMVCNRLSIVFS